MSVRLAMCVMLVLEAPLLFAGDFSFDVPSDDVWQYPFNASTGSRASAPCFGSVGNLLFPTFNDRDGIFVIAWDTSELIPPGLDPDEYRVCRVNVTLSNISGAVWPVDLTPDEFFTFDMDRSGSINGDGIPRGEPGDQDGESSDTDAGRPIELFGAGFGPSHSLATWGEFSFFEGADQFDNVARDPFPFVFQSGTAVRLHVEDNVRGAHNGDISNPVGQFTPTPWAIGVPVDYTPGSQSTAFDVVFDIDLSLSDGRVEEYFREQLSEGRIVLVVTSLREIDKQVAGSPTFYTKEGAPFDTFAEPPRLLLTAVPGLMGDVEGDGAVAEEDYAAVAQCLSGPDQAPGPLGSVEACLCDFDFDEDGNIDLEDVAEFMQLFTGNQ